MKWTVDAGANLPPSRQLVEKVLDALARGSLAAGDQLPSVRKMASEALVNHNTVARAYRDLDQLGVARGQNGRGVFITAAGPTLARAARRNATLEALRTAATEALRAGHPLAALQTLIQDLETCSEPEQQPRKSA